MTTISADPATEYVQVTPIRIHLMNLLDAGVDRARIATLTGVPSREISSLVAVGAGGAPARRSVPRSTAEALMLLRPTVAGLDPATRVLAIGARRRVQALGSLGWSLPTIASWMGADISMLEKLLDKRTRAITVRAHRAISKMYSDHWMTTPATPDGQTMKRARDEDWQGPLAWDSFDLDIAPVATIEQAIEETIDSVAVGLALSGVEVTLTPAERRIVVARAHGLRMNDHAISVLTGIPSQIARNIRAELGLAAWAEDKEASRYA